MSTTKGLNIIVFSACSAWLHVIFLAVSQISCTSLSDWITKILSTDAHTEQDGLLPHPWNGTVNEYLRSRPPAFMYLK